MDENAPLAQSSIDSYGGFSPSAAAMSTIQTYNYILYKYRKEFEDAMNHDPSTDRQYQRELRKVAKEKRIAAEREKFEREEAAKREFEQATEIIQENTTITNI